MGVQLRLLELMGSLEKNLKMLAAILLLCVALGSPAEAVQIDVIYESLCPDSTRFISQQIPPMYEAIGQHVEIRFRPYGFATTTEVDGSYQFECQHGERECYGNIVQACTVHYTSDQDTLVNLITCMMSSSAPDQAGPDCFQQLVWTTNLSRTVLRAVKEPNYMQRMVRNRMVRHPHQITCPGSTWTRSTWLSTGSWRSMASCNSSVILLTTFHVKDTSWYNTLCHRKK